MSKSGDEHWVEYCLVTYRHENEPPMPEEIITLDSGINELISFMWDRGIKFRRVDYPKNGWNYRWDVLLSPKDFVELNLRLA